MTQSEIMSELLEVSENSYFRWKKKDHIKLVNLIERYFEKDDIEEFLETEKIKSFEKNKGYKFISYHYLNTFRTYLEELIKPKTLIDDKHPLVIFFLFLDYMKLDSKINRDIFDYEYIKLIEKMYTVFIINENSPENIKKLLNIDSLILSQITYNNISVEELLNNSKLTIYYLFSNMLLSLRDNNLSKYMTENLSAFKDIKTEDEKRISNQNLDFFIESFNEAYLNMSEFKRKYNDKNLEKEKLAIVNMIIKEVGLLKV